MSTCRPAAPPDTASTKTASTDAVLRDAAASTDTAPRNDATSTNGATTAAAEADRTARLALNQAVEPADPCIGRLLEHHSPAEVLAAIHADQLADLDPDPARRDRLTDRCAGFRLRLEPGRVEAGIAAADAVSARFLTPGDGDWPTQLDDLGEQRPIGIWAIGPWPPTPQQVQPSPGTPTPPSRPGTTPSLDQTEAGHVPIPKSITGSPVPDALSVVGARACTGYGAYIAGALGADLASAGVTVVSGAALGIDAAAHRGALAVGGPTVAVLACGIDRVYPRAHEVLLRTIAERGAVLSELPPGATPTRFRFLHRNRIIAALGVGTVVVEAARRSGSLVTARLAAELGRVVMAVPGPVTSDQSNGTHELIRDGATLVSEYAHVREACASLTAASLVTHAPTPGGAEDRAPVQRSSAADSGSQKAAIEESGKGDPVDPIEELVAEALPTSRAMHGADVLTLARATGVRPDAVFAALGRLAACGRAIKDGGGWMLAARS
jgi:DNA processing protein